MLWPKKYLCWPKNIWLFMLWPKKIFTGQQKNWLFMLWPKKYLVANTIFDYSCCGLKKYLLANKIFDYSWCGLKKYLPTPSNFALLVIPAWRARVNTSQTLPTNCALKVKIVETYILANTTKMVNMSQIWQIWGCFCGCVNPGGSVKEDQQRDERK